MAASSSSRRAVMGSSAGVGDLGDGRPAPDHAFLGRGDLRGQRDESVLAVSGGPGAVEPAAQALLVVQRQRAEAGAELGGSGGGRHGAWPAMLRINDVGTLVLDPPTRAVTAR